MPIRGMSGKRKPVPSKSNAAARVGNGLKPPGPLTAPEQRLWDGYVLTAPHLKEHDQVLAYTWCRLVARYIAKPNSTSLNAIKCMNAAGNRLGFAPAARKQIGLRATRTALPPTPVQPRKRFKFNYFNDPDWEPPDSEPNGAA
jgi:hypothetical protein